MENATSLNRGLVTTLSKEIFSDISELKNAFPKSPDRLDRDVSEQFSKLSRIAETARMRSLSRIFDVLSKAADGFVSVAPDAAKWDIFMRCFRSLQNHLQEIVYERKNTPIILARPLYNLMQSSGMDVSPALAGELFMPYIPFDSNAKARPTQITPEEFNKAVSEHKGSYHEAFDKLVKGQDMSSLNAMRQSMVTLEPKNPHVAFRIFFDASIAFFDRLIKTQQLDNLSKWLVGRIDNELARIIAGETRANDSILSAMLYVVAQAESNTGVRIRKIQDHYGLGQYMADPNGVDPAVMEKFLNVLIKAREMWTQAVASNSLSEFKKLIGEMTQKASYLKNAGFSLIVETMNQVTDYEIANPGKVNKQTLSLEGASALLIMEQQVREGSHMDMARLTSNKLLVMIGKEPVNTMTDGDSVVGGRQHYTVLYRLAEEVLADLGGVEQNLLDYLSGNLDVQEDMITGLNKVCRVMAVLTDPAPAKFIEEFGKIIKIPGTQDERNLLANAFAHLTNMLELLKNSEASAIDAAKKGMGMLFPQNAPVDLPDHPVEQMVEQQGNIDRPNDNDLLDIFLEETDEILASLKTNLGELSRHPDDAEILKNIRRSYHTLKGSGRMVGLNHFGEAAWQVEDTLNRWIKTNKPLTENIISFVQEATVQITGWLVTLRGDGKSTEHAVSVDYSAIEQRAAEINNGSKKPVQQVNPGSMLDLSAFEKPVPPPAPIVIPQEPVIELVVEPAVEPAVEPEPVVLPHPVIELEKPVVEPAVVKEAPALILQPFSPVIDIPSKPQVVEPIKLDPVIELVVEPVVEPEPVVLTHPVIELEKPAQPVIEPHVEPIVDFSALDNKAHPADELPKISVVDEKEPTMSDAFISGTVSTFNVPQSERATSFTTISPVVEEEIDSGYVAPVPIADEPKIPEKWKTSAAEPVVRKSHFENFIEAVRVSWTEFVQSIRSIFKRK